ncbi:hypothetical protein AXF42_Ash001571 [Apostasia shenzhenica]|uniref:Uncharacterized protein n=1 Tax=Apostasia shenzhenica TaxID=1088818 RepID=A0A2I0AAL2_9ASPA|nr:hypothetical protein AXF42_Ash001571 [Apostasia shenzhenica]
MGGNRRSEASPSSCCSPRPPASRRIRRSPAADQSVRSPKQSEMRRREEDEDEGDNDQPSVSLQSEGGGGAHACTALKITGKIFYMPVRTVHMPISALHLGRDAR